MATRKSSARKAKTRFTARTADRNVLYQMAVQDPAWELGLVDKIYRELRGGKLPRAMREDFCGTALFSTTWAKKPGRTAVGIDLDADVLAWGREHNVLPMGKAASRVQLLKQDVRKPCPGKFDVTLAYNFSYFIFRTRDELRSYFESVRASLKKTGLFFLDAYGGYESYQPLVDTHQCEGFTFLWDQHSFDPITSDVVNYIHFVFPDGTKLKRAFSYHWRMWSLQEIREVLVEAGFKRTTVYWEQPSSKEGVFTPSTNAEQDPAWTAYIVAER